MLKVGFIGWRGVVGSVLMDRMRAGNDFDGLECGFFTTSNVGGQGPAVPGHETPILQDAFDIDALAQYQILITCQGGEFTAEVHPKLRAAGWDGYWIDAASTLRMASDSVIILDPINADVISNGLAAGIRDYCGGNCTVSLMLMGLGGLFKADLVDWMTSMTYQAASGGGAKHMTELAAQMSAIGGDVASLLSDSNAEALDIDRQVQETMGGADFPTAQFGAPLAASLLPWIDKPMANGQTREEWKAEAEGNKILGNEVPIPMDGICVRTGTMRCHAQAFTIKLKKVVPIEEIEAVIGDAHEWVTIVANTPEDSLAKLTPAAVTGNLMVPVGRLRKLGIGDEYITGFSVGDQLLWGAAEPLRRMLGILRARLDTGQAPAPSTAQRVA